MKAKSFIKENVLGTIALATILGFSAFKEMNRTSSGVAAQQWYFQPVGGSTDMNNPNNYVPFNPAEHDDCGGESKS